jgi:hypothetical protein
MKFKTKRLFKSIAASRGGGPIQMLLGGLVGAIGWGIGSDIYHRITRGKRAKTEAEAETEEE